MTWTNLVKGKVDESMRPKDESWVLIQSSGKNVPKFEVCYYKNKEWYLPSYDDSLEEESILRWTYIEE